MHSQTYNLKENKVSIIKTNTMKKLTSMVEYNLEIFGQQTSSEEFMAMSIERSWLLNRPIQKEDCVPSDRYGNHLVKPIYNSNEKKLEKSWEKYIQAKEKVIFEGFEYKDGLISYQGNIINEESFGLTRIEELVSWNLILK
jgi:hypothetical protein